MARRKSKSRTPSHVSSHAPSHAHGGGHGSGHGSGRASRASGKKGNRKGEPHAPQIDGDTKPRGGEMWIYGVHAALAALANPEREIRRIVVAENSRETLENQVLEASSSSEVLRQAPELRDRRELDHLVGSGAIHQGIAVLARPLPTAHIEDVMARAQDMETGLIVVLDQINDPQNLGAVLRSSGAFGALAVIVQDRHSPDITGVVAKAASGALETVPLVRAVNLGQALETLKKANFWCIGLAGDGPKSLDETLSRGKTALVMGSEGEGLRRLTRETCDLLAHIPISSSVESLNLSNACAIALYEAARINAKN